MRVFMKGVRVLREEGLTLFMEKCALYVLRPMLVPLIIRRFKRLEGNLSEQINEVVDFAFSFKCFNMSIIPWQKKEEVAKLLRLIEKRKPKVVLELGTAAGGTLFLFCRFSDSSGTIISIDFPCGYPRWKIPLYHSFARDKQEVYLIRADSHAPKTFEKARKVLDDKKVDFLFIDGDHTYDGVKRDFEMFSQFVKEGSIIAFHDIEVPFSGVNKFWNEIKNDYKFVEIKQENKQKTAGIGILYVKHPHNNSLH